MNLKNLTVSLGVFLMAGLVIFGPAYHNWEASAAGSPPGTNRFVSTSGSDSGDCSGTPCLTLQYAVGQSVSGDTINVAAGTYSVSGLVTVDKTLTFLGAQAGVDARSPRGAESIISNSQGTWVKDSNVVIDGFTIRDSSNQAFTGYGVWLNPGVNGSQILNNIFQNNVAGLGLSNGGASQALIKHNLFQNNNLGDGSAFGSGIYTDEFVGEAVSNVLIDENKFVNNNNAGVGFSSQDATKPSSNITITNNEFDTCGRAVYFYNTHTATVTENTITNATVPTDGGTSVGIGVFGTVSDLSILRNNIETGALRGIRIGVFSDPPVSNVNVTIHLNNIFGFVSAGLFVDDPALTGPADFATCNYWGCACGPTNPANPGGTGDTVSGNVVSANFNPWLIGLAPDSPCGTPPAGAVTACKFYDKNANGVFDGSDLPLSNWPITINPLGGGTPPPTKTTDATGCVSWANVDVGPHTVSEGTPNQTNWVHSTPGSVNVNVSLGGNSQVSFGNYCTVASGGLTIGYWGNKVGLPKTSPTDFAALTACHLVNKDGSPRDFTGTLSQNQKDLDSWLKNANATNMAYMLSAQLAALKLNVMHGLVDGNAFALCFSGSVNDLIAAADASLAANPVTTSGSARAAQEVLKNCIDRLNNGGPVVPVTPCPSTFAE